LKLGDDIGGGTCPDGFLGKIDAFVFGAGKRRKKESVVDSILNHVL